jgi:maleylpyruvate isomerase
VVAPCSNFGQSFPQLPSAWLRPNHRRKIVTLYTYFRSSAAYRVRIALNLKSLSPDMVSIHLQKQGGLNRRPEYRAVNPQMRIPALKLDSGEVLIQSLAIIEYLDEVHPQPPFLPTDPVERAKVRAVAQVIACDIHPLNNTAPLRYLKNQLGQDQTKIDAWYHHWIAEGFEAVESLLGSGPYAFGNEVTLADICLVPQVYNARRLKVPLDRFPTIVAADAACGALAAFQKASPENQSDAE